jgi:hypothetical protein
MSSDTSLPRPASRRNAKSGPAGTPGRIRWRRFAIMFVPAAGITGVTQAIPLTMTNVTTTQPYTSADSMTASALQIS